MVYNHLGPEGNYLGAIRARTSPIATRRRGDWRSISTDRSSDDVRWFFIHNALQWIDEFHIDGLRVDAVHAIVDHSAEPFLQDLCAAVHERAAELGRRVYTIAESDLNDPRVITPRSELGLGFDCAVERRLSSLAAHAPHRRARRLLRGLRPKVSDLARVLTTGYLYTGQHSPYRGRKYGLRSEDERRRAVRRLRAEPRSDRQPDAWATRCRRSSPCESCAWPPRPWCSRLSSRCCSWARSTARTRRSSTSPPTPIDDLIEAVRKGRREEFDDFVWEGEPPDPHDEETFRRSKLNGTLLERDEHAAMCDVLSARCLRCAARRRRLRSLDLRAVETHADDERRVLLVRRRKAAMRW